MASFKFSFLLLAVLFIASTQSIPASKQLTDNKIIDQITKIVKQIEKILDQVFVALNNFIDNINDKWDSYVEKITGFVEKAGDKLVELIGPILNPISENTDESGKKLVTCVNDTRAELVAIPVNVINNVISCTKDDLLSLVLTLKPLIGDLSKVYNKAKKAADQVEQCQGNTNEILLCLAQVASDLVDVISTIPDETATDLDPIKEAFNNYVKLLGECIKPQVEFVFKSLGKYATTISQCVAK